MSRGALPCIFEVDSKTVSMYPYEERGEILQDTCWTKFDSILHGNKDGKLKPSLLQQNLSLLAESNFRKSHNSK